MKNTSSSNSHVALIVIGSFVAALQIATLWQLVELRMDRGHGMKPMVGKPPMGIAVGEPNPATPKPEATSTRTYVGDWTWVETGFKNGSKRLADPKKPFVLTLNADMKLAVKGDCNSMFGTFKTDATEAFTVGPLGMTKMFCEGSQENAFAEELTTAKSISPQGDTLIILIGNGGMTFKKTAAQK